MTSDYQPAEEISAHLWIVTEKDVKQCNMLCWNEMFYAAPFLNFYIAVHLLTLTLVGLFQLLVSENYISSQVRGDGKVAFYTFLHLIHDDVFHIVDNH